MLNPWDVANTLLLIATLVFTALLYRYARERQEAIRGGVYLTWYLLLSLSAQAGLIVAQMLAFPAFQVPIRILLIGLTVVMPAVWYRFTLFYTSRVLTMQRRQWVLLLAPPLLGGLVLMGLFIVLQVGPSLGLDIASLQHVVTLAGQAQDDPTQPQAIRLWAGGLALAAAGLALYQFFLVIASARLLLTESRRVARLQARSFLALALLGTLPWFFGLSLFWTLQIAPALRLLPLAWLGVSAYAWWNFSRYDALVAMPVVMDTLLTSLSDALLVMDTRLTLLEANPAALRLLETIGYRPPRFQPVVLGELFAARERVRQRLDRVPHEAEKRSTPAPLTLNDLIGQPCPTLLQSWPAAVTLLGTLPGPESMLGWKPDAQAGPVFQRVELPAPSAWYDVRLSPLFNGDQLAGWLLLATDITRRRQAELAAEEARAAAEAANRAKSLFLANMSHELRTPLNAILGFAELLVHDPQLSFEQREQVDIIARSGEHLLDLINDVLDFSKIEAGRMSLVEDPFDLHQLLRDLEDMFRLRANVKGLTLLFERDPDLVRYAVADAGKLRQILINLLSNAVKFTQQGGVTLRARSAPLSDSDRVALVVEVEDTGPGIAPDELPAVFEPFIQTRVGKRAEGTGLGMPISRQLARLMGGDLTVTSTLGVGTCFRLELPLRVTGAEAVAPAQVSRRVTGLKPGQPLYRLLVVDDVASTRTLLLKLLQPLGFAVRTAEDGAQAVELWQSWQPHLIFMDMRMPVMDGREATRRIRQSPGGEQVKIVALTASAFEEERTEIMAAGCDDFVRKPFREAHIWDVLERHLGVVFELASPEAAPSAAPEGTELTLTPKHLAHLPLTWRKAFHQAALSADAEALQALLLELRHEDQTLRRSLQRLLDDFRFDTLAELGA